MFPSLGQHSDLSTSKSVEPAFHSPADADCIGPYRNLKFLGRFKALGVLALEKSKPANRSSVSPTQRPYSILKQDLNANVAHRDVPNVQDGNWIHANLGDHSYHQPAPGTVEAKNPNQAVHAKSLQATSLNPPATGTETSFYAKDSAFNLTLNVGSASRVAVAHSDDEKPLDLTVSATERTLFQVSTEPYMHELQKETGQTVGLLAQVNRVQGFTCERVQETMNKLEFCQQEKEKAMRGMLETDNKRSETERKRTNHTFSSNANRGRSAPAAKRARVSANNSIRPPKLDVDKPKITQDIVKEVQDSVKISASIPETKRASSLQVKVVSLKDEVTAHKEKFKKASSKGKAKNLVKSLKKGAVEHSSSKGLKEEASRRSVKKELPNKVKIFFGKQQRTKASRKLVKIHSDEKATPVKREVKTLPPKKDKRSLSDGNLKTASSKGKNVIATSSEISTPMAKMPDPKVPPLKQAKASKPKRDVTVGSNEQNQKKSSKRSRRVPRKASKALKGKKQKSDLGKTSRSHKAEDQGEETDKDDDYCYCKKTGAEYYGGWIECGNVKCPVNWFHYHCAGFKRQSEIPAGLWYCHICRQDRAGKMKNPFVFQIAVDKFKATKCYPINGDPDLDNIMM